MPLNVHTINNQVFFIYLSESFSHIRMPLFTVISGYAYAYAYAYAYSMRPVREGLGKLFLKKKSKRILLPFVVATLLTLTARLILPTSNPIDKDFPN
ncbi:acyltransferase family protein [Marinagarivorans cellulosilyticus]|uniref:acyltransferase family protein n=1 Tax=Marinagarivorans cellulosilyticus TaxID=2721545 RepID=UPI003B834F86